MLIDLTVNKEKEDDLFKSIEENRYGFYGQFQDPSKRFLVNPCDPKNHIEKGIYREIGFSFSFESFKETEGFDSDERYKSEYWYDDENKICSYGVADNIDQIKEYFKKQIEDPNNKYVIGISYVFQEPEHAGEGGGWRWHKWGPYIGNLNPQCEYLDDEDFGSDFQGYVLCYNCYKL